MNRKIGLKCRAGHGERSFNNCMPATALLEQQLQKNLLERDRGTHMCETAGTSGNGMITLDEIIN
jgi:hypothetical protein